MQMTATAGTGGSIPTMPPTAGGMGGIAGAVATAGAGGAGAGGTAGASGMAGAGGTSVNQVLPPITDYTKPGPFKTTVTPNTGPGSKYTIYRPDPLGANGFVHSPIIFGPGIATSCAPGGGLNIYTALLNQFSSHGFVTICANSLTGGPGAPANLQAMQDGLDWIIAQNDQAGVFQGKLAVDRAVAMGYSIGAGASINLSKHKAIMTTVVIHDHNTSGDPHGPVLMITGTMDVIDDMRMTLTTLAEAPAVLVALPIGHLDVITEIGATGRYFAPITAWLRYWVNGDKDAKRYFWGDSCEMCKSPWITPEPNDKWKAQML
jgi:hypothetical protein